MKWIFLFFLIPFLFSISFVSADILSISAGDSNFVVIPSQEIQGFFFGTPTTSNVSNITFLGGGGLPPKEIDISDIICSVYKDYNIKNNTISKNIIGITDSDLLKIKAILKEKYKIDISNEQLSTQLKLCEREKIIKKSWWWVLIVIIIIVIIIKRKNIREYFSSPYKLKKHKSS